MVNIKCWLPQTYAILQSPCHNDRCVPCTLPVSVFCLQRHESTEILQILSTSITLGRQTANGQAVLFHHANVTQLLRPLIKICRHVSKYGHDTWSTWHVPVCARAHTNTHANDVSTLTCSPAGLSQRKLCRRLYGRSVTTGTDFYICCSVVVERGRFDHIIK